MQRAFIDHDAFQCGYCTAGPDHVGGQLLEEGHAGDDEEIAEFMSGNICRCAAYPNILAAIREAATRARCEPLSYVRAADVADGRRDRRRATRRARSSPAARPRST